MTRILHFKFILFFILRKELFIFVAKIPSLNENYNFILSKLNYSLIPIFLQAPFDWKATEIEKIPYYFRP